MNKFKFIKKLSLFVLSIILFSGAVNVEAGIGYTYDSNGDPIYSTEGLVAYDLPYTYADLGITADSKSSAPADLFVYEDEAGKTEVYLTDSGLSTVFAFTADLTQKTKEFNYCLLKPYNLNYTETTAIKSGNGDGTAGSKVLFPEEDDIPTEVELNDPEGSYNGDGYIKLYFNTPTCTYRTVNPNTGKDLIYICDKGNNQVVVLDAGTYDTTLGTYEVYQVLTKPLDELDESISFVPKKVITDIQGRFYVIVENETFGIMQFSIEGKFDRYTGTNPITLTPWEIFWRNFSSEEQLSTQKTLNNIAFNSIVYSKEDFMIYTTSLAIENKNGTLNDKVMIKKINPSGDDILRRNGYNKPMGDVKYVTTRDWNNSSTTPSQLVGITVNDYGVYSVIDQSKGRIFTYDNEGNLLYISGEKGIQADKISNPAAIQYLGENLLVLDSNNKTIIKFEPTEIAQIINKAVKQEKAGYTTRIVPTYNYVTNSWWVGKEDTKKGNPDAVITEKDGYWYIGEENTNILAGELASSDYWEQVIKLNANYEYAYVGIGHKYMDQEEYKLAMDYFKLGENRIYYSKAFKQYRDGIIKEWFAPVVITLVVLIGGRYAYKIYRNKKLGIKKEEETGMGDE